MRGLASDDSPATLPIRPASALARYALALVASLAALGITLAVRPVTGGPPFIVFFAAVGVSAWYGGLGPGLLASGLSALLANYALVPLIYGVGSLPPADALRLTSLMVVAALVSGLISSLRAARQRAEASAAEAIVLAGQLEEQALEIEQQVEESQALAEELEEQQAELRATQVRLEQLLDASPTVLYSTRIDGDVVTPTWVSPNVTRVMGYTVDEALDPAWWPSRLHPDERASILSEGPDFRAEAVREYRFRHKDGSYRWVRDEARPMPVADGRRVELVGAWMDITEGKRAEEALERQRALFEAVMRQMPAAVIVAEAPSGRLVLANQQVGRFLRHPFRPSAGIEQYTEYTGYHPDGREVRPEEWPLARAITTGEVVTDEEIGMLRGDGTKGLGLFSAAPVCDREGRIVAGVVTWSDITERKQLEAQLTHQAFHDALTGLANRTLFRDRVEHALARTSRGEHVAVLFLDLDDFKRVNDSLGHVVGDRLLVAVAERLLTATRGCDTVARLGGDEFAILLVGMAQEEGVLSVVERVTAAMRRPISLEGRPVLVSASIGVAHARAGDGVDELLRNADVAMYRAKSQGTGRYEIFEPAMHAAAVDRLELEADLRQALDRQEFRLLYQPIVDLQTGRLVGVEALVRWRHPRRGLVTPATFIPIAEETGLIVPLGQWVLRTACRQMRAWQAEHGAERAAITLSVNVSGRQLQHPSLADEIALALQESGLESHRLVLEITESVIMQDTEATISRLRALKSLGVRLAIDDFGTGYSSLSYLNRFPVDILKIDKSFVEGVERDGSDAALARTVIWLGALLDLRTVAEGVEQVQQQVRLLELGCELAQGYLFAKPLSADEIDTLLCSEDAGPITAPALKQAAAQAAASIPPAPPE